MIGGKFQSSKTLEIFFFIWSFLHLIVYLLLVFSSSINFLCFYGLLNVLKINGHSSFIHIDTKVFFIDWRINYQIQNARGQMLIFGVTVNASEILSCLLEEKFLGMNEEIWPLNFSQKVTFSAKTFFILWKSVFAINNNSKKQGKKKV